MPPRRILDVESLGRIGPAGGAEAHAGKAVHCLPPNRPTVVSKAAEEEGSRHRSRIKAALQVARSRWKDAWRT